MSKIEEPVNVILVADCGTEVPIDAHLLAAVSPVWAERLGAPWIDRDGASPRSVESVSLFEIDSFVGVCSLVSWSPTVPSLIHRDASIRRLGSSAKHLELRRLTSALSLIHKYDAAGAKALVSHLADRHFPTCTFALNDDAAVTSAAPPVPISQWLSQDHINFIVRSQELFDDDGFLNDNCFALLAQALTIGLQWSTCTRFTNGMLFQHGRLAVIDGKTANDPESGEAPHTANPSWTTYDPRHHAMHSFLAPLVLDRSRLAQSTLAKLLSFVRPRHPLCVTMEHEATKAAQKEYKANEAFSGLESWSQQAEARAREL